MSFFKDEATEIEVLQKYLNQRSTMKNETDYMLEESFIEVKVGNPNGNNTEQREQLHLHLKNIYMGMCSFFTSSRWIFKATK